MHCAGSKIGDKGKNEDTGVKRQGDGGEKVGNPCVCDNDIMYVCV